MASGVAFLDTTALCTGTRLPSKIARLCKSAGSGETNPLQPDGLPDPLGAGVLDVHGRWVAPLLAQRNVRAVCGVVHANDQLVDSVLALLERIGDVNVELVVPATQLLFLWKWPLS